MAKNQRWNSRVWNADVFRGPHGTNRHNRFIVYDGCVAIRFWKRLLLGFICV